MPDQFDAFGAVRDAVAIVCEVDSGGLSEATRFTAVGADSLARVGIADLVESSAAAAGRELHIDDGSLSRMDSLGELADYAARVISHTVLRVAS